MSLLIVNSHLPIKKNNSKIQGDRQGIMTSLSEPKWDATQTGQFLATEPLSVFDQHVFPNTPPKERSQKKIQQDLSIDTLAKIVLQCGITQRHRN